MVKRGPVGQSSRSTYVDLEIQMKVEMKRGKSTAHSEGPRTKHADAR